MENKILFIFLLLSFNTYAAELTCPPIADCDMDQSNSCKVDSTNFEISPYFYSVKPGSYEFFRAYITSLHTDYGHGKCLYRNGSMIVEFIIAGQRKVNIENLPAYWKSDSYRSIRNWKCKESPDACVFKLL